MGFLGLRSAIVLDSCSVAGRGVEPNLKCIETLGSSLPLMLRSNRAF